MLHNPNNTPLGAQALTAMIWSPGLPVAEAPHSVSSMDRPLSSRMIMERFCGRGKPGGGVCLDGRLLAELGG